MYNLWKVGCNSKKERSKIGTAEIYRVVEAIPEVQDSMALDLSAGKDDSVILLFVVMQKGIRLNDDIKIKIKNAISTQLSPRYVPDVIIEAPEIPKTLNGKKMEVPIKRILMGMSKDKVINVGSMANPSSLSFYIEFAKNLDIRQVSVDQAVASYDDALQHIVLDQAQKVS